MFSPFVLKDGTFIYNKDKMLEYLNSLGFDINDLENIFQEDIKEDYAHLEKVSDSFEREADHYFCNLRDLSQEIEDLCNKLRVGKGGTKKQMADKIMSVIDYYRI